jgi:hypothetical protein
MMFCFAARRRFADDIEGTLRGRRLEDLARHLGSCASCRDERASQARIAQILGDESRAGTGVSSNPRLAIGFEDRLMHEIRSRAAGDDRSSAEGQQVWSREALSPTPLAAALTIMAAAGLAALYLGGHIATKGFTPMLVSSAPAGDRVAVSRTGQGDELTPREIPFRIRQDLLGQRHGRIPLTTYVLEPAPDESSVVQASF